MLATVFIMSKYISKSGKEYKIEGDRHSGYKVYNSKGNKSVYAFYEPKGAKNHIENLEKGKANDVTDFKKTL